MTTFDQISAELERQAIELPSWAFGNSGTRFKVFAQPGVPRDPFEQEDTRVPHPVFLRADRHSGTTAP